MRLPAAVLTVGWAILPTVAPTQSDEPVWGCDGAAGYAGPTTEYRHGVLGDEIEYKKLVTWAETVAGKISRIHTLPDGEVFEDIAPRCGDLTGDGEAEIVTVIASATGGARLTVFDAKGKPLAENTPIGRANRWLAPAGIADFNGDGQNDIAYVDRPHIYGMLRVWTLQGGELVQIAQLKGFSNHRIGEDFITGGVRDCGNGPELVLPNSNWSRTMVVSWRDGALHAAPQARLARPEDIERILNCNE